MGALQVVRKMGQGSGTRKGQGRGGCAPDVREKQQKEGEEEEKKVGRERRDEEERWKWSKGRERKSGKEGRIAGPVRPSRVANDRMSPYHPSASCTLHTQITAST